MSIYYKQGRYRCQITQQGVSPATTGPQFWLKFQVLESLTPPDDGIEQYERIKYFPLTAKAADWVLDNLRQLGFPGESFDGLISSDPAFHSFKGLECELVCKHVPDRSGELEEGWYIHRSTSSAIDEQIRQANRFLKRRPKPKGADESISDDDVPF